jgi:D-beta-D-heptose 7-phosphate kinase/D-beta-D-heptose 1-phosphate adenosyltransferase
MKIVVNGTFDLLHPGHVSLLKFAKSFNGACVLVLIDSDDRVKDLKGESRPVFSQEERKFLLESLRYVDKVEIFKTDKELEEKIKNFDPDIMVKGSDYLGKPIIGSEYCKEIVFYDRIEEFSTTEKIQSITNR